MPATSSSFNRALVALYDLAECASHDDFPVEALRTLRPWIQFDCASLGVIVDGPLGAKATTLAQVTAHALPVADGDDMMHLLGPDRLADIMLHGLASPTLICGDERCNHRRPEIGAVGPATCRTDCEHHVRHRIMFIECQPREQGAVRWIVLCRNTRSCFSGDDTTRLRAAWCHLLRAMDLNRRFVLIRHNHEQAGRVSALISAEGRVIVADADFHQLLRQEWSSYGKAFIPEEAMSRFTGGHSLYRGRTIELEVASRGSYMTCTVNRLNGLATLTHSEYLVAQRFANGLSHKSIARELGISPNTVRNQIAHLYNKLGINNKAALARHIATAHRHSERDTGNAR